MTEQPPPVESPIVSDEEEEFASDEDDEETIARAELEEDEEDVDELADLENDNELTVEQLKQKYGGGASAGESSSSMSLAPLSTSPLPAKRRRPVADLETTADGSSSSKVVRLDEGEQETEENCARSAAGADCPTNGHHAVSATSSSDEVLTSNGFDDESDDGSSGEGAVNGRNPGLASLINGQPFDDDENDGDYAPKEPKQIRVGAEYQVVVDDVVWSTERRTADAAKRTAVDSPMWLPSTSISEHDVIIYLASLYTNPKCGGCAPLRTSPRTNEIYGGQGVEDEKERIKLLVKEVHELETLNGRPVGDNECMLLALFRAAYDTKTSSKQYIAHYREVDDRMIESRERLETKVKAMPDMELVHKSYSSYQERLTNEQLAATANEPTYAPDSAPPPEEEDEVTFSQCCDTRWTMNLPCARPWMEPECDQFENALVIFSKRWHLIRKFAIPHRTVAEIVLYYYAWKKSERHDMFIRSHHRLEKRGNIVSPHSGDHMEQFVEQLTPSVAPVASINQFYHNHLYNPADITTHHYSSDKAEAGALPLLASHDVDAVLKE